MCARARKEGLGERRSYSVPTRASVNPTRSCACLSELSSVGVRRLNLCTSVLSSQGIQDASGKEHDLTRAGFPQLSQLPKKKLEVQG